LPDTSPLCNWRKKWWGRRRCRIWLVGRVEVSPERHCELSTLSQSEEFEGVWAGETHAALYCHMVPTWELFREQ
jgi:hypothetical protein